MNADPKTGAPNMNFVQVDAQGNMVVRLSGDWEIDKKIPSHGDVIDRIESDKQIKQIDFDTHQLGAWDSGLLTFLTKLINRCNQIKIHVQKDGLPQGVQRLVELAMAVPEKTDTGKDAARIPFFERVGTNTMIWIQSINEIFAFIGEAIIAFLKFLTGKANYRRSDLLLIIQESGAQALPIVSLISLLVGLILGFVGAVQLALFGAQIYVANLVGIAMVRVLAAVMTGIIMAGRTGASFAAQLGTMQVNEELDALTTLGVSPMEFLVLPRMLALTLMMPLLSLWANLMGILGGTLVGVFMLDINPLQYYAQTIEAVDLTQVWIGLFHSFVFGIIISLAGCLRGIQCGRSASAVGEATTSAVVTSIVGIIVATAVITFLCNVLGI